MMLNENFPKTIIRKDIISRNPVCDYQLVVEEHASVLPFGYISVWIPIVVLSGLGTVPARGKLFRVQRLAAHY